VTAVNAPTPDEIRAWPAAVRAVPEVAAAFGISARTAYRLIQQGEFPVPILTLGRSLRCTRASVMDALGIPEASGAAPSNSLASAPKALVQASASDARSEARTARYAA
jgi:predicted DNA-binding transcriptional regulator AlpA